MPHHPMHATPSIPLVAPRAQRRAGQWRAMAALTLAVVLVHVLLLAAAPLVMLAQAEPNAAVNRAFTTRTISMATPAATATPARTRRAAAALSASMACGFPLAAAAKPAQPPPLLAFGRSRLDASIVRPWTGWDLA